MLNQIEFPANSSIIADKGFISQKLARRLYEEKGAKLITPARRKMPRLVTASIANMITKTCRRIETVISQSTEAFNFNTIKSRSFHGLIGRLNHKILSYTTALFFNYQLVKDQFTQLELLLKG
ncbi:MAG: transposase [Burkholderiales bacterium]